MKNYTSLAIISIVFFNSLSAQSTWSILSPTRTINNYVASSFINDDEGWLLVERSNGFVRFHAWQAILGLGGLGLLSAATLIFSFLTLLLSPVAFTLMYRLSEVLAIVWVLAWVVCLIKAFAGSRWHMPVAGRYAERLATDKHG